MHTVHLDTPNDDICRIEQDVCYVNFVDARDNAYIYIAREGSTSEFCACLCVSQSVLCVYCGDRINQPYH